MLRGLPGSGKSTYARELVEQGKEVGLKWNRVSKDEIRGELEKSGWKWSKEREKDVISIEEDWIRLGLLDGNVVVDSCNFGHHEERLKKIAEEKGADFRILDISTPIEECIARDASRSGKAHVGEEVIRGMARKWTAKEEPVLEPYKRPLGGVPAIICDLDGTAALLKGRDPYNTALAGEDAPNYPVLSVLQKFASSHQIIYLSGREAKWGELSLNWLKYHSFPESDLLMRKTGDFRKDYIVKYELFKEHIEPVYNVLFVLDDRNQVVNMWRKIGLTCFQVAEGNF